VLVDYFGHRVVRLVVRESQRTPRHAGTTTPLRILNAWGDRGHGPGKLDTPAAFAADSLGRFSSRTLAQVFVHKFESSGTPLLSSRILASIMLQESLSIAAAPSTSLTWNEEIF